MGVVSRRWMWVESMGVASECCCKEVYIFCHVTYPYSSCILFFAAASLLSKLVPGDTVQADRGFDISDSVGSYCSTLKVPVFTRGKTQLSGIEVEQTRKIANVRTHV